MHKGQPLRRTRFLSRYIRVLSSINSDSSNLIFQNWQIFLENDRYNHRVRVQQERKLCLPVFTSPVKRRIVKFHFVIGSDGNFRCLRRRCPNGTSI